MILSILYHPISDVDLNVTISIEYSPLNGVTSLPPNYRAATSVSLRCDAERATGSVRYQWSSTCSSDCFVSGTSQTVTRDRLGTYDAGQHTCIVTDDAGNIEGATTQMSIFGKYNFSCSIKKAEYVATYNIICLHSDQLCCV